VTVVKYLLNNKANANLTNQVPSADDVSTLPLARVDEI